MSKTRRDTIIQPDHFILFVCEGKAERIMVNKLLDAAVLPLAPEMLIGVTRERKADVIEQKYFNVDYDAPVTIIRVLDSLNEQFKTGKLYQGRYSVVDVCTRPEVEMLVIHKEDQYKEWAKSHKKPSAFCIEEMGMSQVKSEEFLKGYWDAASIVDAAETYRQKHKFKPGEHCLRDLWE